MKVRKCAYCSNEFGQGGCQRTAEHIFPQGLLELYPEQDISITPERTFKDNSGLTIADVCDKCNNGKLSLLDNYGNKLIKEQFYDHIPFDKKDDVLECELDFPLLSKWLLKIAYNYQRSRKKDCKWFEKVILYIMEDKSIDLSCFSIFIGLHVNVAPLPEDYFGYMPLSITENPILLGTSMALSTHLNLPIDLNTLDIPNTYGKLVIRLGNAVFYLLLWEDEAIKNIAEQYNKSIKENFNFRMLVPDKAIYKLKRITANTNMFLNYSHILSISALKQDDFMVSNSIQGRNAGDVQKLMRSLRSEKEAKKSQLLVELSMFPENRKLQEEYNKTFGKDEI